MPQRLVRATRWASAGVVSLLMLAVATVILRNPDRVADRLLRIGGRIIQKGADEIRGVAIAFIAALIVVWVVIGLRCLWERWRDDPV